MAHGGGQRIALAKTEHIAQAQRGTQKVLGFAPKFVHPRVDLFSCSSKQTAHASSRIVLVRKQGVMDGDFFAEIGIRSTKPCVFTIGTTWHLPENTV